MKTDYAFPVALSPIKTAKGIVIPHRMAVIKNGKTPIGIVSDRYALIPHETVVDTFLEATKGEECDWKARMSKNGARMHFELTLPNIKVKVDKGDEIALRLIVENSYDGQKRLQVVFGAFRLVCSNGMIIGRKFLSLSQRHVGDGIALKVETVREQIEVMVELFKETEPVLKKMAATELVPAPEEFFDPKKLRIPAYLAKAAREAYGNGETVYDAYNALTATITRGMKKESPRSEVNYGRRAWNAATALVK